MLKSKSYKNNHPHLIELIDGQKYKISSRMKEQLHINKVDPYKSQAKICVYRREVNKLEDDLD